MIENKDLMELATYIATKRLLAEVQDSSTNIEYSPQEGLDLVIMPGCLYLRCVLGIIDSPATFYSLATLIMNRLGFMDWDYKTEVFAPTYNPPQYFPEQWKPPGSSLKQYFWVKITTKSRPQFRKYRDS